MDVTQAVTSRRSIRHFLDKPVDPAVLKQVLETARRSPSGGNTQPWNAIVLTGQPLADFTAEMKRRVAAGSMDSCTTPHTRQTAMKHAVAGGGIS